MASARQSQLGESRSANGTPASPHAVLGGELAVPLACPRCGAPGSVRWEHLGHDLRCPKCRVWFQVERNGQSVRWHEKHPYSCPRCRQRGSLVLATQQPACPGCGLRLLAGPSGRLYSAHELEKIEERSREAGRKAQYAIPPAGHASAPRRFVVVLAGATLGALVLLVGGVFHWQSTDTVHAHARTLTRQCLAGDWRAAIESVGDDDEQRAEFRRWQIMYFASVEDRIRPAGDEVRIQVADLQGGEASRVLELSLSSRFIGERKLLQVWRKNKDAWRFDVVASLRDRQAGAVLRPVSH